MTLNPMCALRTFPVTGWGRIFVSLKGQRHPLILEIRRCILFQLQQESLGMITIAMTRSACQIVDQLQKDLS
jgi:hypothetical protein